jgi:uncharacterized protein
MLPSESTSPLIQSTYAAPFWLPDGHSQTIFPALVTPRPTVQFERFQITLRDGDFIHLDALPNLVNAQAHEAFVLLLHGLEGSSQSHYALALMEHLRNAGLRGAVAHWRGCSGQPNILPRSYHSGASEDIADVVRWTRRQLSDETPLYVVGVSLGGNALLKWLGQEPLQTNIVDGAMAISAPHSLSAGADQLAHGFSTLYTRNFMSTMIAKSRAKLALFDMPYTEKELSTIRNFHHFDEIVTARVHGFKSAQDYWDRSSCKQFLKHIARPTLIVNAKNDPFLPVSALAKTNEVSEQVHLEYPDTGGHVGFAQGRFPGNLNWLPTRAFEFFGLHSNG